MRREVTSWRQGGILGRQTITHRLLCLLIVYTDLNGLICKTHLAVETSGVVAHRITSVAWKRSVGGIVRPSA